MKRRDFIKNMSILGASQFVLNSVPFKLLAGEKALLEMAANCPNDRILIILQLHGGNDGLNMLIPTFDYDLYQNRRPNIAIADTGTRKFIPLDGTLANEKQVGLHPDMVGIKQLYDEGKVAMVQGVSYENHNQSHFRGRDILFMGGGANDYLNSGWVGRYLQEEVAPKVYPQDFPNADMKDPLALEFGNEVSLIFHQGENIPTSVSIIDPQQFFDLVDNLPGFEDIDGLDPRGIPPTGITNSPYGKELNWILNLEQKADEYHDRLKEVYDAGKAMDPNVAYPTTYPYNAPERFRNNTLSGQLQIIANLIHGGSKTKVYMVRLGGFDTHAQQVENFDASMGSHAALLYHISSAMKSFQDDLKARSIDDRVLTVTTSEFGRRVHSNGSYGTDHGIGAPLLLFGKHVQPGMNGVNPDLNDDNVAMQYDYRHVYSTVMKEWMCVDPAIVDGINGVFHGDYSGKGTILPLINNNSVTSISQFIKDRFKLHNCYPNPASHSTTFSFYINGQTDVQLKITDINGKEVKTVVNKPMSMGEHKVSVDLRDLPAGTYIYHIKTTLMSDSNKLMIVR